MNQSSREAHLTGISSSVTRQATSTAVYKVFIPPWVVHRQLEQRPDPSQAKATTPLITPECIVCLRSSELSSAQRTG